MNSNNVMINGFQLEKFQPIDNNLSQICVQTQNTLYQGKREIKFTFIQGRGIYGLTQTFGKAEYPPFNLIFLFSIQKISSVQIYNTSTIGVDFDDLKTFQSLLQNNSNIYIVISALSLMQQNHHLEKFKQQQNKLQQYQRVSRYLFYFLLKIFNFLQQITAKFQNNNNQYQIAINNQYNQQIKSQNISLRGGGALCSNKIRPQEQKNINYSVPDEFFSNSEKYCQRLIDKIPFDEKDSDTLISFQWFLHNEINFWFIANNRNLASSFYEFSLLKLEQFLMISTKYLSVSGFLFYYLLKICNYFCQVIVKQQSFNEKREIKEEKQQELKVLITEINQQIQVESSRIWMTGVLYELQLIQTSITHLRTNSTKGRDALLNFIAGVATSLVSMKLTDELKKSLQDGAQLLLTMVYEEHIMNPIENYKIFQYFKEVKWQILLTLGTDLGVYYTLDLLQESYNKYIKKSKNWIVHFCWIEMISEIFAYQPIISKKQFKIQDWNSLLVNNHIQLLPYDRNEAKLNILINKQNSFLQNFNSLGKVDYQEFQELKEQLLKISKNHKDQEINLWNQYQTFEFESKNTDNHHEQKQILLGLLKLDDEYFNRIVSLYNQSKESLINLEKKQIKVSSQLNLNNSKQQKIELITQELTNTSCQIDKNIRKILLVISESLCYFSFIKTKLTHFFELIKPENIFQEFTLFAQQFIKIKETHLPQVFQTWFEMQDIIVSNELNERLQNTQNQTNFETITQKLNQFDECVNLLQDLNKKLKNIEQMGSQFLTKLEGDIGKSQQITISSFYKLIDEIQILELTRLILIKYEQEKVNFIWSNFLFLNKYVRTDQFWKFETLEDQKDAIFKCHKILKFISFFKLLLDVVSHKFKSIKFSYKLQNHQFINEKTQTIIEKDQIAFINQISLEIKSILIEMNGIKISTTKLLNKKLLRDQFEKIIIQMEQHLNFFEKSNLKSDFVEKFSEIINIIKQQILELQLTILLLNDDQCQKKIEIVDQQFKLINSKIQELLDQFAQKELKTNNQEIVIKNQLQREKYLLLNQLKIKLDDDQKNWNIIHQILIKSLKNENQDIIQIAEILNRIEKAYLNYVDTINQIGNLETTFSEYLLNGSAQLQLYEFQNFFLNLHQYVNHQQSKQKKRECEYLEFMLELQNQQSNQKQQSTNIIFKLFQSNSFRVRECLLFQLIQMQNQCSDNQILKFSQELIKQFWIAENNQNVRSLLKNQELIDFQKKLFNHDLQSFSEQIKEEMQKQLKQIELLEEQARIERNSQQEDEFEEKLKKLYQEFEDKFDNVTEMSDKVGLNLLFLKDMAKDIKVIKNKIDKLQETVNIIGNDIKKLRGKNFMEVLQIRKEQVLMNKIKRDLDSVYIELLTQEIDPNSGQIIQTNKGSKTSCLFKEERLDFEGEINEFLWAEKEKQKDVMLIKGQAGSGKTRASKMIEEYLWTQQNQFNDPWIPIFVSLPQLKDPKYNLFYEVLESENYHFDTFQIKEFIEAILKKSVRLLLILDSYDEMKLENIESNLFKTNKFQQEFSIETPGETIKMIVTVRSEILNQQNYQLLFYGNSLYSLKEIMLLPFQQEQTQEYLRQFSFLNIKRKISNFYDYQKQIRGGKFQIKEFLEIWTYITPFLDDKNQKSSYVGDKQQKEKSEQNQIIKSEQNTSSQLIISFQDILLNPQPHFIMNYFGFSSENKVDESQSNEILTQAQIDQLIKSLKKQKIFEGVLESQYTALQKDLIQLWSKKKFQQTIVKAQISHLLQTPFMMEIIVQVLPNIITKSFDYTRFKDSFIENFKITKSDFLKSNFLKNYYKNNIGHDENRSENLNLKKTEIMIEVQNSLEAVLKNLETIKFFQKYNISENIFKINQVLKFQNQEILIGEDIDIVIKCLQMTKITAYQFYENFVQFYSESQLQKWRDLGKISNIESYMIDFVDYQQSLAIDLTIRQLTQINYNKKGRFQKLFAQKNNLSFDDEYWKDKYFANNSDDDSYYKILKSCILLSSNGSTYQFTHKSIQEYFIGKYILDIIIRFQSLNERIQVQQQWISNEIFNSNSFNISQGQYQGCLKLISDQLEQITKLEESLLQMIILSRNKDYIRTASNSIYLLSYLQSYIENYNLSEIQISDSIISGLSLPKCNLSKTQFNNVIIDQCNLNQTNLTNVMWKNCIYNEKKIFLNHKHSVQCITYSQDGKIMISGDSSGKIIIWDAFQTKVIHEFNQNQVKIKQLINYKQNILISEDEENVIFWNIENLKQPQLMGELDFPVKKIQISSDEQTLIGIKKSSYFEWDLQKLIKNFNRPKYLNTKLQNIEIIVQTKDENYLFLGNDTGEIVVYEINLFQEIDKFQAHQKKITILKLSETKKLLISASLDCIIKLWNFENIYHLQNVRTYELSGYNYKNLYFAFNEMDLLGIMSDNFIYLVDDSSQQFQGKTLQNFPMENYYYQSCQYNQVLSFEKEFIRIYDFSDLTQIVQVGKIEYQEISLKFWFIKTNFLALVYKEHLEIWNLSTKKLCETIYYQYGYPVGGTFSHDETQIALLSSNNYLEVYSIKSQTVERSFQIYIEPTDDNSSKFELPLHLEYSQQNNYLAIIMKGGKICIYNTDSFQEYFVQLFDDRLLVQQLLFTSNDDLIIAFKTSIQILLFKETTNIVFKTIYDNSFELLKLFIKQDKNQLIIVYNAYTDIRFVKFNCDNLIQQCKKPKFNFMQKQQQKSNVKSLIFLPLQNCFIVENSGEFNLLNIDQDQERINIFLDYHEYQVEDLCFSNNRKYLASISQDELFICDQNLEIIKHAEIGGSNIYFSENDSKILISNWWEAKIFNFDSDLTTYLELDFELNLSINGNCLFSSELGQQYLFDNIYNEIVIKKFLQSDIFLENINYNQNKIYIMKDKVLGKFKIINFPKNIKKFRKHITNFQQHGNGELLVIHYDRQVIHFYQYIDNCIFGFFVQYSNLSNLPFHYMNKLKQIIKGNDNSITIYDCSKISLEIDDFEKQPQVIHEFKFERGLTDFYVNEKQQIIISTHYNFIYAWNLQDKQQIFSFYAHSKQIQTVISSSDGNTFTTGGDDCKIKIWKFQHSQMMITTSLHQDMIREIQYSNDAQSLISLSLDQSIIVFDLIKKKAVQKSNILNQKIYLHSDYIIKIDSENQLTVFGNQDNLSLQYLQLINDMWHHRKVYNEDKISLQQDENQKLKFIDNIIISQDRKFYIINFGHYFRQFKSEGSEIYWNKNWQKAYQTFGDYFHDFHFQGVKLSNLSFNQTKSSMFISVANCNNEQLIVIFEEKNQNFTFLTKDQYRNVTNVILNDNLLLIKENSKDLKLLKNISELFESYETIGQYKHDSDIISQVLDSSFVYFIDKNGMLIILNTKNLDKQKKIDLEFIFDENNTISTSILYEQFYAVGLINGKLLIWNVGQENQTLQLLFFQFQLPKKQPILQIQFLKKSCIVGCLCNNFIWFINYNNSQGQIFRSTYNCLSYFAFYQYEPRIMHFKTYYEYLSQNLFDCINYESFSEDDVLYIKFISKDELYLAYSNTEKGLKLYDLKNKRLIKTFNLDDCEVVEVKFSIKNKRIVIFYEIGKSLQLDLWTIENFNNLKQNNILHNTKDDYAYVEISYDEDFLLIATRDFKLHYISIKKMEIIFTIDDFEIEIRAIAFSPNLLEFALGFDDGSVRLYDFNTQQIVSGNNQASNMEEKRLICKPICTKIFSSQPLLMSYGCKLNDKTKIENKDGQSLVQILISKQAEMIKNEE